MVNEQELGRPYAPPSNVVTVLRRLRSRNLPESVDGEYLRDAQIPEGTVSRTLFAMKFIGLIDDYGTPSQELRTIHAATDEEYAKTLAGLVREAYADVFAVVDLAEDDQASILNVFRKYSPASQRSRMVVFFLGMCKEATIPVLDTPRQRHMGGLRGPQPTLKRLPWDRDTTATKRTAKNPALQGLIDSLPPEGAVLSAERREQWLEMARAALKFIYPEPDEPPDPRVYEVMMTPPEEGEE